MVTLKQLRYLIFALRCINAVALIFVAILLKAPLLLIAVFFEVAIALIFLYLAMNTTEEKRKNT